jgi:excinuclease ABC subunit C
MEDNLKDKIEKLPKTPGVYIFKDAAERVLYVGKAKDLKKRVKNHFAKPEQHVWDFIKDVADIDFIKTDNENEALLLEQQLIKKIQPRFNIEWKDDKNYFFVAITNELFPRVFLTHQPVKSRVRAGLSHGIFGPFVNGREVKAFLREIRKILPYRSCRNLPKKPCFYQSLNLCVAPCVNKRTKKKYQLMIETLKALLAIYVGKIYIGETYVNLRIEGYDISNLSGTLAVGSMVVFENGAPNKNGYRRFRIKKVKGQNDVASLREVLSRRMKHNEWPLPDLMLLDGGKGQLKAARGIDIPALALAKFKRSGGKLFSPFSKNYLPLERSPQNIRNILLRVRDEAHRFAITYHKSRREKALR